MITISRLILLSSTCFAFFGCNSKPGSTKQGKVASERVTDTQVGWEAYLIRASFMTPSESIVVASNVSRDATNAFCYYTYDSELRVERLNKVPANPEKVKRAISVLGAEVTKEFTEDKVLEAKFSSALALDPIDLGYSMYGDDTLPGRLQDIVKQIASRATAGKDALTSGASAAVRYAVAKWQTQRACALANPKKCESLRPTVVQLSLLASVLEESDATLSKGAQSEDSTANVTCPESLDLSK